MDYKIAVPKPCHEDWNAMTPDAHGRFCMQCSKSVTDFTGMKAAEIQAYLIKNSEKKVCGRFNSSQLDTITIKIPETALFSQTRFRNIFLLALLVSMGTTLFSCNNGQKIDEVAIEKESIAVDSADARPEVRHTVGITTLHDSVPFIPLPATCEPGKTKVHIETLQEPYVTGAVAVEPSPPPPADDHAMMGDIVVIPKSDSLLPPPKVKTVPAPKSNPGDLKIDK